MVSITSFVKHWEDNIEALSTSKGYIEHLLLAVGLISRDIYSYQFSNQDPDDAGNTPSYCHNNSLNLSYHKTLMLLVSSVFEQAQWHMTGRWPDIVALTPA